MKKVAILYSCLRVCLFFLFAWQTIYATIKYLERTTITSTYNEDDNSILFPSVTVCKKYLNGLSESDITRPPLSSDIIIFTDRPELKAKGERIIFEDREVLKRKFSLGETALFNPDRILVKLSRILTEN